MLVEARRCTSGSAWRPRKLDRGTEAAIGAEFRHHLAVRGMIGGHRFIDIEYRAGRQADSQHAAGQLVPIFICKARAQRLRQRIPIEKARRVGREPRITCQFHDAEKLAELSKGGIVAGGNEDLAVRVWNLEYGARLGCGLPVAFGRFPLRKKFAACGCSNAIPQSCSVMSQNCPRPDFSRSCSAIRIAMVEKRPVAMSTIGLPSRVGPLVSVPLIDISPTIAWRIAS